MPYILVLGWNHSHGWDWKVTWYLAFCIIVCGIIVTELLTDRRNHLEPKMSECDDRKRGEWKGETAALYICFVCFSVIVFYACLFDDTLYADICLTKQWRWQRFQHLSFAHITHIWVCFFFLEYVHVFHFLTADLESVRTNNSLAVGICLISVQRWCCCVNTTGLPCQKICHVLLCVMLWT